MRWIELLLALGLLVAVAVMVRSLVVDFRNGVARRRYVTYDRATHPRSFWLWTIVNTGFIAIVITAFLAAAASVAVKFLH